MLLDLFPHAPLAGSKLLERIHARSCILECRSTFRERGDPERFLRELADCTKRLAQGDGENTPPEGRVLQSHLPEHDVGRSSMRGGSADAASRNRSHPCHVRRHSRAPSGEPVPTIGAKCRGTFPRQRGSFPSVSGVTTENQKRERRHLFPAAEYEPVQHHTLQRTPWLPGGCAVPLLRTRRRIHLVGCSSTTAARARRRSGRRSRAAATCRTRPAFPLLAEPVTSLADLSVTRCGR